MTSKIGYGPKLRSPETPLGPPLDGSDPAPTAQFDGALTTPADVGKSLTISNILVATDLSAESLRTIPYAVTIAKTFDAAIHIGTVLPLSLYLVARPQSFDVVEAECRSYAEENLGKIANALNKEGMQTATLVEEGDVGEVVHDWIRDHHIDLVIAGTIGRSGIRKLILGSVAEELICDCGRPVLTVGPAVPCDPPRNFRRVLLATDYSTACLDACGYASMIAHKFGAELTIVHVAGESPSQISETSLLNWVEHLSGIPRSVPIEFHDVVTGDSKAAKIITVANDCGANLIVIGLHNCEPAWTVSHFGSTSHDIIVQASCPVLTVPTVQTP